MESRLRARVTITVDRWADAEGMTDRDLKEDFEGLVDEWVKGMVNPKYPGNRNPDFVINEWEVEVGEPREVEE